MKKDYYNLLGELSLKYDYVQNFPDKYLDPLVGMKIRDESALEDFDFLMDSDVNVFSFTKKHFALHLITGKESFKEAFINAVISSAYQYYLPDIEEDFVEVKQELNILYDQPIC